LVHVPLVLKITEAVKLENPMMYQKSSISPLNQNIQPSNMNMQPYGSQQNFNNRKVSPSPPVNRVNTQGLSPAFLNTANNSNVNT
jgi:hypothetical protein